jgi:adenylylsulfate kinase-like enzyme
MKKRKQENIDGVEHVFYEDLTKQVKELKYTIDKNEALFAKQLRPRPKLFDIQSTSKIRLGCQLLREHKRLKKIAKEHAIASFSGWSFEQPAEEQVKNDNYKVDIDKLKNEIKDISNEDTKK